VSPPTGDREFESVSLQRRVRNEPDPLWRCRPCHNILTQGTAIRSLMRNLGGSIGISVLVSQLVRNTQVVHALLVERLWPDNPLAQAPFLPGTVQPVDAGRDRRAQR
jgi:hypothetical protein